MINVPVFAQTPKSATAVTTAAAGLGLDNSPGTVLLMTAGASGSIITGLQAMPRATNTATNLIILLSKDGGTTQRVINSKLLAATTVSSTTVVPVVDFGYTEDNPLRLAAGDSIYVGSMVALATYGVCFMAEYSDF